MDDYDAGLLNDWGGGNVDWWHDYLRSEIGRANAYWAAQVDGLRDELAEVKRDSERYRWLTYDHDDAEQRKRCREIWDHGCVMSYSALSADIDAAMAGGK